MNSYGFEWGPMRVTRMAIFPRGKNSTAHVLGVETDHHKVQVYVSRTGRSVRVYIDGKEMEVTPR